MGDPPKKGVDPLATLPTDRVMQTSVMSSGNTTTSVNTVSAAAAAAAAAAVTNQQGNNGQQNLASLFECPVCFDYALPPIMQCLSGHIVCGPCRTKLASCPSCRGQLGNVRNLAMDRLAEDVLFPCKYSSNSCPRTMHYREKLEHEDQCDYRPYQCPCPGAVCKWLGALDEVMPHLTKDHRNITTLNGEDIVFLATDINLPGAVDWVMMQSCFGCHFMLVLEKQDRNDGHQNFYAIVQLIGNRRQATNFKYRLELSNASSRLVWEAVPRSIHDGISHAIAESDCLVFDAHIARRFAENNNLGINVAISIHSPSSIQ